MFTGRIQGLGPRYCPSVEDKITRFADKERHQIFVEPEGWNTIEIYVNGFSTSLPEDVQEKALRKIKGFENAKMFRPGYAIEYDYFPPTQLELSLETKCIKNLFFAGQINGTTGYEEAACQGLVAGINAHQSVVNDEPYIMKRSEGYIGVLIDDLVNKGTEEPYRMFTSRAEYRILLRQDNADIRLAEKGRDLKLLKEKRFEEFAEKKVNIDQISKRIEKIKVSPQEINSTLISNQSAEIREKTNLSNILKRPNIELDIFKDTIQDIQNIYTEFKETEIEEVIIDLKYKEYIQKEQDMVNKLAHLENMKIPEQLDYTQIIALSNESKQKLNKIKPKTLGQASRISGVSPSDVSILMIYLTK
jgi:tRNA uridine 5-carboxymethylaminomethyl modification enzyme